MKRLKKLNDKENLDGFCLIYCDNSYEICVNVEKLWNTTISNFIDDFVATYVHEMLHCAIKPCYRQAKKWEFGEEMLIRHMMYERISKYEREYYNKTLRGKKNGKM